MIFYDYLYYFTEAKEVDIIVCDFNIDTCSKSRLSQILSKYIQLVEFPTHSRVNIRPCVCKEVIVGRLWSRNCCIKHIFFWSDAVRVKISKKDIDFIISWLKMIKTAIHLEYFYIYSWLCTHLKSGFNNINRICK